MSVPTNLIPTKITGLPEYTGTSGLGFVPYVLEGRTYKAQLGVIFSTVSVPSSRLVSAGAGLLGGGALSSDITLFVNFSASPPQSLGVASAGTSNAVARGDHVHPAVNLTDTTQTQGALPLGRGGTGGALSPVAGAVVYSTGSQMAITAAGTAGQVLTSGGAGAPVWSSVGTVTSVGLSGGTTGLTVTGSPITTSGTMTLGGTLAVANGGTGVTTSTGTGSVVLSTSPTLVTPNIGAATGASLQLSDTWNNAGTTFTAASVNITDTASAAGSLLINLQVGGASRFAITKAGALSLANSGTNTIVGQYNTGFYTSGEFRVNNTLWIQRDAAIQWDAAGQPTSNTTDLVLRRDAANTLAQRNGTNVQTMRVYKTFTDASNNAYFYVNADNGGGATNIGFSANGTGGSVNAFQYLAADHRFMNAAGLEWWRVNSSGHFFAGSDNSYDIGASSSNRPRRLYVAGGSLTGSQADSSLVISPTWNTTGTPTAVQLNVTDTASNANSLLMDLQVGGVSKFSVTKGTATGTTIRLNSNGGIAAITANGNTLDLGAASGGHDAVLPAATFRRVGVGYGFFLGTQAIANSPGLFGSGQEADYTIAQRNGTNAQTFRIYNTFTDASNYERGKLEWATNVLRIGTEKAGTGVARGLAIQTDGTDRVTVSSAGAVNIPGTLTLGSALPVASGGTGQTSYTDGQLLIGNTATGGLSKATITAGGGISVTNGNGTITIAATGGGGTVTSVAFSGGTTGLTVTGSPITTSGTITLAGTLAVANGGTGVTTSTGTGSVVLSTSPTLTTPTLGVASATSIATALGSAAAPSHTFTGDTNTGMFSPAADTLAFAEGGVEAMRIDSSGNVGIGTNSPATKLDVNGQLFTGNITVRGDGVEGGQITFNNLGNTAGPVTLDVDSGGNGRLFTTINNASLTLGQLVGTGGIITLHTAASERMRITAAGDVGIGTSSPGQRLDVNGSINTANNLFTGNGSGVWFNGSGSFSTGIASSTTNMLFYTSSSERMRITAAGRVGIGTTTPGYALDVVGDFRATTDIVGGATIATGNGISTGDVVIELGGLRTGSGNCYIDLHATNGTDFEARVLRNSGVNGAFDVFNTGTGVFNISQVGAAPLIFKTTDAERMRIDSSGNVAIGTSSPTSKFDVFAASGYVDLRVRSNTTQAYMAADTAAITVGTYSNVPMLLTTNNTERMRIDSSGNVGIGTSTATARLRVAAAGQVNAPALGNVTNYPAFFSNNDSGYGLGVGTNATDGHVWLQAQRSDTATAYNLTINEAGGNVGIGTSSPSVRLDVNAGTLGGTAGNSLDLYRGIGSTTSNNRALIARLVRNTTGSDWTGTTMRLQNVIDVTNSAYIDFSPNGTHDLAFGTGSSPAERFRISSTGAITSSDLADAVGYKGLPQVAITASRTLALTDQSKDIYISGTTAAQTVTIPANASVAFPVGTIIQITNDSNQNWSIAITTDTLVWSPSGTTGTRTLAAFGQASIRKVTSTRWWISGTGLT